VSTLPKKLLGFVAFIGGGHVIRTMKYADENDLVLPAKEGRVLQRMIDRLRKIGRWYGMEMWTKIT
jgi:hypothetical protein